jgi:RNA polymerase sigma-70 factor (ECF subfamily)
MLVNAYSRRIFNMAYQFTGTFQEAEDMTQEIFLKLYTSLSKYDFEKNFNAWLLTLTKNYLIDNYRKTKWEKKTRDNFNEHYVRADPSDSPEAGIEVKENKKFIWEGLNQLSSEVRMTVILRDIQGKKYDEIADIMNLPLGTIKSRVNRGRIQLAKILKQEKEKNDDM